MGRASSAKKVAKAASVGESRRPGERRLIGFPAAVALTIVAGIALVAFAVADRKNVPSPTLSDRWVSAYAIYDCEADAQLEPQLGILDSNGAVIDPDGIHSHDDGLIHIHPANSSATGSGAQMKIFITSIGAELTDDSLTLADGTVLSEEGTTCDGEDVTLQILRWSDAATAADTEPEVITDNLADVEFDKDGEAFTIALAPLGSDIPVPETIPRLATVNPASEPTSGLHGGDDGTGLEVDPDFEVPEDGAEVESETPTEESPAEEDAPVEEEAPAEDEG